MPSLRPWQISTASAMSTDATNCAVLDAKLGLPFLVSPAAKSTPARPKQTNARGASMRVKSVICCVGRSGYMHRDLMAIKAGARPDGFLFHGKALSPGFRKIVEPASIVSVMLELEDGQIAFGDCADVILAGVAGRDPAFRGEDHIGYLRRDLAQRLKACDVSRFRANAEAFDRWREGGKLLHTAVRYGIT